MNANTEIPNRTAALILSACLAAVAVAAMVVTHFTAEHPFVLW